MNEGQRALAPRSHRISWLPAMAASLAVTALASCAALPRLDAVPESLTEQATVPGIPDSPNLRRSYGSLLLNAGANAEVIQELLGARGYAHDAASVRAPLKCNDRQYGEEQASQLRS